MNLLEELFPRNYKCLQITQNLACIKHVDLVLASSVLNVNLKIRKEYLKGPTCSNDQIQI